MEDKGGWDRTHGKFSRESRNRSRETSEKEKTKPKKKGGGGKNCDINGKEQQLKGGFTGSSKEGGGTLSTVGTRLEDFKKKARLSGGARD